MIRAAAVALIVALLPAPAVAGVWRGGAAPPSIAAYQLVAEPGSGGGLAAIDGTGEVLTSDGDGAPFTRIQTTGLPPDLRVAAIASVSDGLRMVATDEFGTIYGSTDGGKTWLEQGWLGDTLASEDSNPDIVAWAIDPLRPDDLVRVHADGAVQRSTDGGFGWVSGYPLAVVAGSTPGSATFAGGALYVSLDGNLWRSDDLADTWHTLPAPPGDLVVPSPADANVLWSAGAHGLFRSGDGGQTWERRITTPGVVVASPDDPQVAWAIDEQGLALLTTDGGLTWRPVGGAPSFLGSSDAFSLILQILFGITPLVALPGPSPAACYVAIDAVWCSHAGTAFAPDIRRMTHSFAGYGQVVVDPVIPGDAYGVTGSVAWETTDGSASWHAFGPKGGLFTSVAATHAGTFVAEDRGVFFRSRTRLGWKHRPGPGAGATLAADPLTGTIYATAGGRLWRANRATFRRLPARGLHGSNASVVTVGGHGRTLVMSLGATGRLKVSTNGGRSFRRLHTPGDAAAVAASPFEADHLIATTRRGIAVSDDGGETWQVTRNALSLTLVPDPGVRGRWFSSFGGVVQESTDDGRTWHRFASAPSSTRYFCCKVAVSPGRLWWLANPPASFIPARSAIYWRRLHAPRR